MQSMCNWSHFLLLGRCHISSYPKYSRCVEKGEDYIDRFVHPPWKRDETSDTLEASHNNFAWISLANEANVQWRPTFASWGSNNNNTEYDKAKQGGGGGQSEWSKGAVWWVVWTFGEKCQVFPKVLKSVTLLVPVFGSPELVKISPIIHVCTEPQESK
jgi:hypothetical protein